MPPRTGPDRLLVFVKEPRPGRVKSRLAAGIGPELAAGVARALAEHALRRTAPLRDEYERTVLFTPAGAREAIAQWLPGQDCRAQAEGDLGVRMAKAFAQSFRTGARRVALIGTDVPGITRDDVLEALESLDAHDVAIGPAADGGYWLLALGDPAPALFRDIPWSTSRVLEATLERAGRLPRGARVLRTLADVDTVDDLVADWARISPALTADVRVGVAARLARDRG